MVPSKYMVLNEYISEVLQNIDKGFTDAKSNTKKSYYINNDGVTFDIAVTVENRVESAASGKMNAGVIQVLGAGVSGEMKNSDEKNEINRIKFSVYVPSQTDEEIHNMMGKFPNEAHDY